MQRTRKMLETEIRRTRGQLTVTQNRARDLEMHLIELGRFLDQLQEERRADPEIDHPFETCPRDPDDLIPGSVTGQVYRFMVDHNDSPWSKAQIVRATRLDRDAVGWALTGLYHARLVQRRQARGCYEYRPVQPPA